jgi:hypothetical protein
MHIIDVLIDVVAKSKVFSIMDGYAGYNQIPMTKEDIHKTTFRCPGSVGAYKWVMMHFRLKNIRGIYIYIYQKVMNMMFHDLIGE